MLGHDLKYFFTIFNIYVLYRKLQKDFKNFTKSEHDMKKY